MKILVCGGRNFNDWGLLSQTLDQIRLGYEHDDVTLIHGACSGVDSLAETYAMNYGWTVEPYTADWKRHGRAAGPIRNQRMLDEGKPDLVIAFPGGRGTADMVRRARKAEVSVRKVRP